ncbi:zinc finger BED domain-containing protein DAYSLEEPER-like [Rutidosis leptorrhynchoides]|uniref:zinc finger BED domain-containing protein DAYSLEEPER-like n=1 Tax=Rutidosis leptorrhynchoides TaxID=125765 RepID=UPI003A99B6F4
MQEKFDKYWEEYSEILSLGSILDPRMKLELVQVCFEEIDPINANVKVERVMENLKMLFAEYMKDAAEINILPQSQDHHRTIFRTASYGSGENSNSRSVSNDMKCLSSRIDSQSEKSQLDKYLEEPRLNYQDYENLDVLAYWKDRATRFPELTRMACDVLSIPITTVASESTFSIGGRVLNKYRNSLLPTNVQALICTRNWLHGYEPTVDEIDVMKVFEPAASSVEG